MDVVGSFLSQGVRDAALCPEGEKRSRDVRCVVIGEAVWCLVTVCIPSGVRLCAVWLHALTDSAFYTEDGGTPFVRNGSLVFC
jgi:hypothetical protein